MKTWSSQNVFDALYCTVFGSIIRVKGKKKLGFPKIKTEKMEFGKK